MTQPIDREIAMALAKEAGMAGMLTDVVCSFEEIHRLCNLAVAHSRKDAEPVAWLNPIASFSVITKAEKDSNSFQFSDEFLAGHTVPLYAHPLEADKLLTYGDQRAAEAREQMREELLAHWKKQRFMTLNPEDSAQNQRVQGMKSCNQTYIEYLEKLK